MIPLIQDLIWLGGCIFVATYLVWLGALCIGIVIGNIRTYGRPWRD